MSPMEANDQAASPNLSCEPSSSEPRITSSRVRFRLSPHEAHTYLKESNISLQNEQHVTSIGPSPTDISDCSMACSTSGDTSRGSSKGPLSEEAVAPSPHLPTTQPAHPQHIVS